MMKLDDRTGILELSPHGLQFLYMEIVPTIFCLSVWFVLGLDDFVPEVFRPILLLLGIFLFLYLVAKFCYFKSIRYEISLQQLIFEHGVFTVTKDYVELYRVIGYEERRIGLQRLFGLKTVSIYSGDRTTPRLDIIGVKKDVDLQNFIRERVELIKLNKGVYEITNR